jgi:hypothetical protein
VEPTTRHTSFLDGLLDDGRPALSLTGIALLFSGAFALFLSARREFLPHDVAYLGMTAAELCDLAGCRIVHFMFHDRVAFGGSLISIAVLYLWLAAFPLRDGARWAWWTFVVSGVFGFGSFLGYLGYGYLDDWHGVATLALLPIFVIGLLRNRRVATVSATSWPLGSEARSAPRLLRLGRWGLVATGVAMFLAGCVILTLGSTAVFVAEDLAFMDITRPMLDRINPRLVPLIAHDRAGFGGGLLSAGTLVALCSWYARPTRAFHQAMFLSGLAGFGCAIGVHYVEGYTNLVHLTPAFAGAALFTVSLGCEVYGWRPLASRTSARSSAPPSRPPATP